MASAMGPYALLGLTGAGSELSVERFLIVLAVTLFGAKVLGELAERIGQPAVVGELVAGVLLGSSVLGLVDPSIPTLHLLAEVGVLLLLFSIGLETDLKKLLGVGPAAAAVALTGVVVPFVLGFAVARVLGLDTLPATVAGAALTATSVGITARVLSDLNRLHEPEGQVVLGAAIIDDVIGLVILAVVADLVAGDPLTVAGIAVTTAAAFGFLIAAVVVGRWVVPPLFRLVSRTGKEHTLASMALVLAFAFAVIAAEAGSALIIGAFAAGLVLGPTEHSHKIERGVVRIGSFFVPIFFVSVGAAVDVRSFVSPGVAVVGLALTAVAILGKFIAGFAAPWVPAKKSIIGVGMIPRGEVGLIFAQTGLAAGVLTSGTFSALMFMVLVTTLMTPPLLRVLVKKAERAEAAAEHRRGVIEMTTEA